MQAISNPVFPLIESAGKNLLKLYLNDVGILTGILYGNNIRAILDDQPSVNLGSVYETVVANELKAHGYKLFYYDHREMMKRKFHSNNVEVMEGIKVKDTAKRAIVTVIVFVIIYVLSGPIIGYTNYDMYLKGIEFLSAVIGAGCYWIGSNKK